jgi:predicted nuclease of restriction endonuclease-like RecB superfamily
VLTADLVSTRRRGDELKLVKLDAEGRARAIEIARALIATASLHVGGTRGDVEEALSLVTAAPREQRLRDALRKLVLDRCEFDANDEALAAAIREDVFTRAAAARAALPVGQRFDRVAILGAVAHEREISPDSVESLLFADLRAAHRLLAFSAPSPEALVAGYEHGQAQAVLLRAVKVTVELGEASGASLRALFRRLKFLRLLHTIGKTDHGHRVVIDGPYSLFESVTKYGLSLALVLPALEACESWKLVADVRWGKERTPLVFRCESPPPDPAARRARPDVPTSDEVSSLVKSFRALGTTWRVSTSTRILELPGIGLTIPDLLFERDGEGGKSVRVFLEVMGYWSRDAVWKRVELVQAGLPERMLFAVSSRLRVSEEVLPEDLPGALYVYKGTLSARVVAERLEALAARRAEA